MVTRVMPVNRNRIFYFDLDGADYSHRLFVVRPCKLITVIALTNVIENGTTAIVDKRYFESSKRIQRKQGV